MIFTTGKTENTTFEAMPYREKEIEKLYYPIGEVAEMLQLSHSQIRFWEKEFDILKPVKNKKGNRLFSARDIESLKKIQVLLREKGYTLQGARQALMESPEMAGNKRRQAIAHLQLIREQLLRITERT